MDRPHLVLAGGSGLVGHHLIAAVRDHYDVTILTRHPDGRDAAGVHTLGWRPDAARAGDEGQLSKLTSALEGAAAVVNLAGTSIRAGRLGPRHLGRVLSSRVDSTTTLVTALGRCRRPPGALIQASAVGIYGQRGDALLPDDAPPGERFVLAGVGEAWEAAVTPATARTRVCIARFGVVFGPDALAWRLLVLPVRLGLGGPLGSGRQWFSWIDADDLARALRFLIEDREAEGTFNLVAPDPVRQRDLTRMIGRRLRRPTFLRVPAFALRLALGRLADAALLQSARAVPRRLLERGFAFEVPDIATGVRAWLPAGPGDPGSPPGSDAPVADRA